MEYSPAGEAMLIFIRIYETGYPSGAGAVALRLPRRWGAALR